MAEKQADVTWVDLSSIGLYMGSWRHPTDPAKSLPMAMVDTGGAHDGAIRRLGFRPMAGIKAAGIYVRDDTAVTRDMLFDAFGKEHVRFVKGPATYFNRLFQDKFRERTNLNAKASLAQSRALGLNHRGEVVFESALGRYLIRETGAGRRMLSEGGGLEAADFLRVDTREDLRKVAQGFVSRITIRNELLRRENIVNLMELSNRSSLTARDYQEAIEAEINSLLVREIQRAGLASGARPLDAYDVADKIYHAMPELRERTPNSIANQQYSTPIPMAVVAQALLTGGKPLGNRILLDPTIGNGSLVLLYAAERAVGGEGKVFGVEIDPARVDGAQAFADMVVLGDATQTDFRRKFGQADGFDLVIANPPFGSMDGKREVPLPAGSAVPSMSMRRLDQFLLLRALNARKDIGRAVFITGSDSVIKPGEVSGASQHLLAYLYDHYEIDGVVDVSGDLYKKHGAGFPLRFYVVGNRRPEPVESEIPTTLPVIRSYEGLRAWAQEVLGKLDLEEVAAAAGANDEVWTPDSPYNLQTEPTRWAYNALRAGLGKLEGVPTDQIQRALQELDAGDWTLARDLVHFSHPDSDRTLQFIHYRDAIIAAKADGSLASKPGMLEQIRLDERMKDGEAEELLVLAQLPAPVPHPEAQAEQAERVAQPDNRQESEFQQRYVAFSNVGDATSMIPANLSGPVYEALSEIRAQYGDIDDFVAKELDYPVRDLGQYFTPEQVDAIAMISAATNNGLGFLLADQMGIGKGRVLAACARRERLQGRVPMFVTIADGLFSDFLERDIAALDSRHLFQNPLIVNDGAKTVDASGQVVAKSMNRTAYVAHAEAGRLPEGTDIVMLTYSQLAQRLERNRTVRYMHAITASAPISLLLDESHKGAGSGNTSTNLSTMIDNLTKQGGNVIYSSGTPIKGAKNLSLYKRILPKGVDPQELLDAVASDPISLQEALNYEIAAQGCLISRELDNTGIEKEFVLSRYAERNERVADQLSEILTAMNFISGDVRRMVSDLNKEMAKELEQIPEDERAGQRMGASSLNFPSRMHSLMCQLLIALKAPEIVDLAVEALEANEKPIIALQRTGEAMLADILAERHVLDANDEEGLKRDLGDVILDRPVNFRDYMHRTLERIMWITTVSRYGEVSSRRAVSEEMGAAEERIKAMIDRLPDDLPLTPIDFITEALAARGYSTGEVSGRGLRARTLDDGRVCIEAMPGKGDKTRANRVVREFNNGDLDVVILTVSGAVGYSLQAGPAVGADVRTRVMIKGEMQADIAMERQMDGRPNRTGQVCKPKFKIPQTGLPADDRLSMMFNSKNRSLTASTVANRDSADLIRDVPDLLNAVGDMVAQELLEERWELTTQLDIEMKDDDDSYRRPPLYYIKVLTGRICLLRVEEQRTLYADLQARFHEKLDKLKAEGRNPLEVECHAWGAKLIERSPFMGTTQKAENKRSQLNSPVYLSVVEYNEEQKAVKAAEIDKKIALAVAAGAPDMTRPQGFLRAHRGDILQRHTPKRFKSVEEALAHAEPNEAKNMLAKLEWLEQNLGLLKPGSVFMKRDLEGVPENTVVLRVAAPTGVDTYARLSDYVLYTMRPGSDAVTMETASSLFANEIHLEALDFAEHGDAREAFDSARNGIVTRRARLLDGNVFEATALNMRQRVGRKVVYTDESGARQHGILVYADISDKKLAAIPERLREPALVAAFCRQRPVTTDPSGNWQEDAGVKLRSDRSGRVEISVPGTKKWGGRVFTDPVLTPIEGAREQCRYNLAFRSLGGRMVAEVPADKVEAVARYLIDVHGYTFYTVERKELQMVRTELATPAAEREPLVA